MSVAVVEKSFLLLETLAQSEHPLALKQLARVTKLPKPTTHRLLQTLQERGYVIREPGTRDYLLGHRIQELARSPLQQRIKDAALPLMQKLHKAVNETVNLGVLEGTTVRYVDYIETARALRYIVRPGQTDSVASTALGRAILSSLSTEDFKHILSALPRELQSMSIAKLKSVVAAARARGWAEEQEETVKGVSCLAVSLKRLGFPRAAISISIPTVRDTSAFRHTVETLFKRFNEGKL